MKVKDYLKNTIADFKVLQKMDVSVSKFGSRKFSFKKAINGDKIEGKLSFREIVRVLSESKKIKTKGQVRSLQALNKKGNVLLNNKQKVSGIVRLLHRINSFISRIFFKTFNLDAMEKKLPEKKEKVKEKKTQPKKIEEKEVEKKEKVKEKKTQPKKIKEKEIEKPEKTEEEKDAENRELLKDDPCAGIIYSGLRKCGLTPEGSAFGVQMIFTPQQYALIANGISQLNKKYKGAASEKIMGSFDPVKRKAQFFTFKEAENGAGVICTATRLDAYGYLVKKLKRMTLDKEIFGFAEITNAHPFLKNPLGYHIFFNQSEVENYKKLPLEEQQNVWTKVGLEHKFILRKTRQFLRGFFVEAMKGHAWQNQNVLSKEGIEFNLVFEALLQSTNKVKFSNDSNKKETDYNELMQKLQTLGLIEKCGNINKSVSKKLPSVATFSVDITPTVDWKSKMAALLVPKMKILPGMKLPEEKVIRTLALLARK